MFRIKICGITSTVDALAAARAGADAIGLNFYAGSRRFVQPASADKIVQSLPAEMAKIGLFVNSETAEIRRACDRHGLDFIQLHGDEPPAQLAELGDYRTIKAFRIGPDGLRPALNYLARCDRLGCVPALVLLDAHRDGKYGGTGEIADWQAAGQYRSQDLPPLVLAGGLTADNVAQAIRAVHPLAVDTASGVESSPGHKDHRSVEAFVRAAAAAFDEQ